MEIVSVDYDLVNYNSKNGKYLERHWWFQPNPSSQFVPYVMVLEVSCAEQLVLNNKEHRARHDAY